MNNLNYLLKEKHILRKSDKEKYFDIKSSLNDYKEFIEKEVGYKIIMNDKLIKLDKKPHEGNHNIGIREFTSKEEFLLFIALIIVLDSMDDGEQFILSELISLIKEEVKNYFELDLNKFFYIKRLVNVLKYAEDNDLLVTVDGYIDSILNASNTEVLYQNTGISKYFSLRDFKFINYKDESTNKDSLDAYYDNLDENIDVDKGVIRKNRVYKRLLTEPIIFDPTGLDPNLTYIKNQRFRINENFQKYLDMELEVYNDCAFLVTSSKDCFSDLYPDDKAITGVSLRLLKLLRDKVEENEIEVENGTFCVNLSSLKEILAKEKEEYGEAWGKGLREISLDKVLEDILGIFNKFGFILNGPYLNTNNSKFNKKDELEIIFLPSSSKYRGVYPKDFINKLNGEN